MNDFFRNKKVLLMGLGILGGGVGTAKFLLRGGARLRVTDRRDKKILSPSIQKLPKKIKYTLGKHKKADFDWAQIIVANPAVSVKSEWIKYCLKNKKEVVTDLGIFLKVLPSSRDVIGITGTRGKTTNSLWIHHFLNSSILGGNIPEIGPLKIIDKKGNPFVLEISSFQLEYMGRGARAFHIALITNLYQDHLNRHATMSEYARVKAKIFLNQTSKDFLVLNANNNYTKIFLNEKPKSRIYFFSISKLPKSKNGIFLRDRTIYFQENGNVKKIARSPYDTDFLNHNLLGAMLTAYLYCKDWKKILSRLDNLPQVAMRREVVLKRKDLTVVNDSAGTSPEATLALLDLYRKIPKTEKILITGGTDKQLDFKVWANEISNAIFPENVFFLDGSATKIMIDRLNKKHFWKNGKKPRIFSNLKEIINAVYEIKGKKTILFSPGSASFEKFKNEFDRGGQFTKLSKKFFQY